MCVCVYEILISMAMNLLNVRLAGNKIKTRNESAPGCELVGAAEEI